MTLDVAVSAHCTDTALVLESVLTNLTPRDAYLVHLSPFSESPISNCRYLHTGNGGLSVRIGGKPSEPPPGVFITWPARDAGERIAPGESLSLRTVLSLPLQDPFLHVAEREGVAPIHGSVSEFEVVYTYAIPPEDWTLPPPRNILQRWLRAMSPPAPRPRRMGAGFDLYGAPHFTLDRVARVSPSVPFIHHPRVVEPYNEFIMQALGRRDQ
jgi:hypothetical protein